MHFNTTLIWIQDATWLEAEMKDQNQGRVEVA